MQNDAKLGLLAGVLGVIIVSVMSADRPRPVPPPPVPPGSPLPAVAKPPTPAVHPGGDVAISLGLPAVLPADLSSTPVSRTKKDTEATPAARTTTRDDDLDP